MNKWTRISISSSSEKTSGGFTMLELMIIVVIIGLVAAMAVPTFYKGMPKLKARTEARNVLNLVRLARSKAISEGTQYGVYINTANKQYLLFKDTLNPTSKTYEIGDLVSSGPINIERDVLISALNFTNGSVVFLPTGEASQSGSVTFNISGGGAPYSVSVLASTGKSKLQ